MGWTEDLELGKRYELVFFENELITENEIYQSEGLCKGWDLMTMDNIQYEVKVCRRWRQTGNLLVEFGCTGKRSGISTTTSDYWAFYQLGKGDDWIKVILIPTYILKELIEKKRYHRIYYGAEYKQSDFFLFKENVLDEYKDKIKITYNSSY